MGGGGGIFGVKRSLQEICRVFFWVLKRLYLFGFTCLCAKFLLRSVDETIIHSLQTTSQQHVSSGTTADKEDNATY